jgi:hypothetical protein
MNTIRTWVGGLGISAPCVFVALAMTPGPDSSSSGPVHGRVTYRGHPLHGGYVHFEPEGNPNHWAIAPIEQDGHYSVDSKWQRVDHGREGFRIRVVSIVRQSVAFTPSPSHGASPDEVPMSLSPDNPDSRQSLAVDHRLPERFSDTRTSGLHATLGPEPARVDIDLKD